MELIKSVALLIDLTQKKRNLEAELDNIKEEIRAVEQPLVEEFAENGLSSLNVNGYTAYLHNQLWAKVEDGRMEDFTVSELGELVKPTVNAQSLSAAIRELPKDNSGMPILPKNLIGVVKVSEIHSIRIRSTG